MSYPRAKRIVSLVKGDQVTVDNGQERTVADVEPHGLDLVGGAKLAKVTFTDGSFETAPTQAEVMVLGNASKKPLSRLQEIELEVTALDVALARAERQVEGLGAQRQALLAEYGELLRTEQEGVVEEGP
jgi:hypothetical protein